MRRSDMDWEWIYVLVDWLNGLIPLIQAHGMEG